MAIKINISDKSNETAPKLGDFWANDHIVLLVSRIIIDAATVRYAAMNIEDGTEYFRTTTLEILGQFFDDDGFKLAHEVKLYGATY